MACSWLMRSSPSRGYGATSDVGAAHDASAPVTAAVIAATVRSVTRGRVDRLTETTVRVVVPADADLRLVPPWRSVPRGLPDGDRRLLDYAPGG